jgi:two-component sensor histidine kinase
LCRVLDLLFSLDGKGTATMQFKSSPSIQVSESEFKGRELLAEANHRVANSLALLGGLVRMQGRALGKADKPPSKAELHLMFDGIAARINTIGQLHRRLALMPAEGAIDLGRHIQEVCDALVTAFSSNEQPIHIQHRGSECLVLTRHVQPITLIICEILTNAMKYAHPAGVALHVAVACDARPDGTLLVSVSDDGIGLPEGFDVARGGGVGFQVVRALSAEMGAELELLSDNLGVTFTLTVPAALVANAKIA